VRQPYPTGRYLAALADPPWSYATYSAKGKGRSAEAHYDVMSIEAISAMPVASWMADDAVLFLWATDPILPRAFEVIEAWGFEHKTTAFTWVKGTPRPDGSADRFAFGLGHWTRSNPEICLLATRGKPHRLHADVPQLLIAPRRAHSVKPDEVHDRIERLLGATGPYLELFANAQAPHRPRWTHWVGKNRAPARRWGSKSYPGAEADPPGAA
jgi:N6-adenosine-specific RNA methylase IME4